MACQSVIPTRTRHFVPSILPFGSCTVITLLFYEAAFPTIEMSSWVLRNRLEEEASDGPKHSLLSSREEAHSNCVANAMTSLRGGLTQLKFSSVSRRAQLLQPPLGRAVWEYLNAHIDSVMCLSGSCDFKQCELLSKEVAWKMPQLAWLDYLEHTKEKNQEEVGKSA